MKRGLNQVGYPGLLILSLLLSGPVMAQTYEPSADRGKVDGHILSAPFTLPTGVTHERIARPPAMTAQAPQNHSSVGDALYPRATAVA